MSAIIINGKELAEQIYAEIGNQVAEYTRVQKRKPLFVAVFVGNDPQSAKYVKSKRKRAESLGISVEEVSLPGDVSQQGLNSTLTEISNRQQVDAVLLQLPLPKNLQADLALECIAAEKDVDGLSEANFSGLISGVAEGVLLPCTPAGCLELVRAARRQLGQSSSLSGLSAVVVGRSKLVGQPMAALLSNEGCRVTVCHSQTVVEDPTKSLADICRTADILVSAAGSPGLIAANGVKPGAIVIDVGINYLPEQAEGNSQGGKIVGDVAFEEVLPVAAALTPVPGGVGPMTICMLMRNIAQAAESRCKVPR